MPPGLDAGAGEELHPPRAPFWGAVLTDQLPVFPVFQTEFAALVDQVAFEIKTDPNVAGVGLGDQIAHGLEPAQLVLAIIAHTANRLRHRPAGNVDHLRAAMAALGFGQKNFRGVGLLMQAVQIAGSADRIVAAAVDDLAAPRAALGMRFAPRIHPFEIAFVERVPVAGVRIDYGLRNTLSFGHGLFAEVILDRETRARVVFL